MCREPAQAETEAKPSCNDAKSSTSGRKLISHISVTMGGICWPWANAGFVRPAESSAALATATALSASKLQHRGSPPEHPHR